MIIKNSRELNVSYRPMPSKDDPVFVHQGSELTQEQRHGQPIARSTPDYKAGKWKETKSCCGRLVGGLGVFARHRVNASVAHYWQRQSPCATSTSRERPQKVVQ